MVIIKEMALIEATKTADLIEITIEKTIEILAKTIISIEIHKDIILGLIIMDLMEKMALEVIIRKLIINLTTRKIKM